MNSLRTIFDAEKAYSILNSIVLRASDAIAIVSSDHKIIACNRAAEAFWNRSKEQIRAITWPEMTHPDDVDKDKELVQQVLSGEIESYELVKRYTLPDGSIRWALLYVLGTGVAEAPLVAIVQDPENQRRRAKLLMLEEVGNSAKAVSYVERAKTAISELKEAVARARKGS
jgi:PAS domain S-box-containing protein